MSPAFLPLKTKCEVPKESHVGTFPANFCVKMIGDNRKLNTYGYYYIIVDIIIYLPIVLNKQNFVILIIEDTNEHLVIRQCVLENMNSQCGTFKFENDTFKGCILTCDYDGCNRAPPRYFQENNGLILSLLLAYLYF